MDDTGKIINISDTRSGMSVSYCDFMKLPKEVNPHLVDHYQL